MKMKKIWFSVLWVTMTSVAIAQVEGESQAKEPQSKSGVARFFRIQHAEDQAVLLDISEGLKIGGPVLWSNRLNFGLYFGDNLLSTYVDLLYGSTELSSEKVDDHIKTELEADHYGFAYGFKFQREVLPFFFPYVGIDRTRLWGKISEKFTVEDDEDAVSIPLESYKLNNIHTTSLSLGGEMRLLFWKVLTVATAMGVEIPLKVSDVGYKTSGEISPRFITAAHKLEKKLKDPLLYANISFGFSF